MRLPLRNLAPALGYNDVTSPAVLVFFSTMRWLQISNPCLDMPERTPSDPVRKVLHFILCSRIERALSLSQPSAFRTYMLVSIKAQASPFSDCWNLIATHQ